MHRRPTLVLCTVVFWGVAAAPIWAQSSQQDLKVGGQTMLFADTNMNGCPDESDGGCAANVMGSMAPNAMLNVECFQGPATQGGGPPIQGLFPSQMFGFQVLAFDMINQSGQLRQVSSSIGNPKDIIQNGTGFMQQSEGGPVHVVQIATQRGSSSGVLCTQGGPATLVKPTGNAPAMLFALKPVNCAPCNSNMACMADPQNPTHLKLMVPLRGLTGGFVQRDVFIPLMNGMLTLAMTNSPGADIELGSIVLRELGFCPGRSGAPTVTDWGLMLLILLLLSAGAWGIGRRPKFAQSVPLP